MTTAACDFCGLPVLILGKGDQPRAPTYCCLGCEFAAEVTRSSGREGANRILLLRIALATFFTMNVLAFTMVLWSHDVYPDVRDARSLLFDEILQFLGLVFSLPVWFLLGQPLLLSALGRARQGIAATDLLVCAGVMSAYGFSMISTWRGTGPVYYEVACVVLILITLGRWLESQGKLKASEALDELARLLPDTVRVRVHDREVTLPIEQVQVGDRLRIRAGECIGVDGVIQSGSAQVDQRLLTGESCPVEKQVGDTVRAGTFNLDGSLDITATSTVQEGSLGRVVNGLREARLRSGSYEQLAERVTQWFLPIVVTVAVFSLAWHGWTAGIQSGMLTALSVLLIACPCALGLATPLAAWTAFGQAARHQVLFRHGAALEQLATIRAVAWDKTGTLTSPRPSIKTIIWDSSITTSDLPDDVRDTPCWWEYLSLARHSNHPFSQALVASTPHPLQAVSSPTEVREQPGRGIIGVAENGDRICLGNARLADELGLAWPAALRAACHHWQSDGLPTVICGRNGLIEGVILIQESLREGAADVVYQLQTMGLHQFLLTGDHAGRTDRLVRELFATRTGMSGVTNPDGSHPLLPGKFQALANLLPEDKARHIRDWQDKLGPVAMIGDGVNDALALTTADVGISLCSGADIARDSAAVCLFGDDIRRVPWAIDYARFTVHIMRQNLFWAFGYNTVGVTLAALGYLNPSLAALLMVGSSGFVIVNTCRLNRFQHHSTESSSIIEKPDATPQPKAVVPPVAHTMNAPLAHATR